MVGDSFLCEEFLESIAFERRTIVRLKLLQIAVCHKHLFHGNYGGLSRGVVYDFHFRVSCSLVDYQKDQLP